MSRRRRPQSLGRTLTGGTLIWVAVIVVALLAVDAVLVALALARTAPGSDGTPGPIPTFTSSPDPTGSATPTAPASADPAAMAAPARRLLSAVDGLEAWRASSTSCDAGNAVLEHTTDGGESWQPVTISGDVRAISGMRATTDGLSVLTAVSDDCTDAVSTTTDAGVTWRDANAGAAGAGVTSDGVVLGATTEHSPCSAPVDAFQGDRTAVVVCDRQIEWREGSAQWVNVPLDGVRSVAVDGDEYTLARVGTPSCDGVQIESMPAIGVTAATATTPIGCNHVDSDGPIAIDRAGDDVWMWAGDSVTVSDDGGATW